MDLPGLRLHELKGDRKGTWSVTVSGNWRVTFRFEGKDALDVDYVDYRPEMAVRLSIAFDTSAESWLNQQTQYDLWIAEKRRKNLRVEKLAA